MVQTAKICGIDLFFHQFDTFSIILDIRDLRDLIKKIQESVFILEAFFNCPNFDSTQWMHQAIIINDTAVNNIT